MSGRMGYHHRIWQYDPMPHRDPEWGKPSPGTGLVAWSSARYDVSFPPASPQRQWAKRRRTVPGPGIPHARSGDPWAMVDERLRRLGDTERADRSRRIVCDLLLPVRDEHELRYGRSRAAG